MGTDATRCGQRTHGVAAALRGGRGAAPGRFGAAAGMCRVTAVLGALRRAWRVTCAVARFAFRHCPKWLIPVFAVALAIPGPAEDIALTVFVLVPVLRSRENRAELAASVRDAWKG